MSNWNWETRYDRFLSLGSWSNAFLYGAPAGALLSAMYLLGLGRDWWTPVLLIYAIAAMGHISNHGFMALNLQMKTIADHWERKLGEHGTGSSARRRDKGGDESSRIQ